MHVDGRPDDLCPKGKGIISMEHPTFHFSTFLSFVDEMFGHKCIFEHYQDGEIWSEDEVIGTFVFDFEDDSYYNIPIYVEGQDAERIINKWRENGKYKRDGSILKDWSWLFNIEESDAFKFYQDYLKSDISMDMDDYFEKIYKKD